MSSNQYIEDQLIRHQIRLQRYGNGPKKDIIKGLRKLSKAITDEILLGRHEILPPARLTHINGILSQMINEAGIRETITATGGELAAYEVEYMEGLLGKATTAENIIRTSPELIFASLSEAPLLLTSMSGKVTNMTMQEMIDNFAGGVENNIMLQLRVGVGQGKSTKALARDVNRVIVNRSRREAEALVRTIVNQIGSTARGLVVEQNREILKGEQYVATLDNRTTILCFHGETVVSPVGKVEKVYKRLYSGKMVTVTTATGNKITGTPNHPILTPKGWLTLDEIKPGKHVLYSISIKGASILSDKRITMPSTIAKLFDSFSKQPLSKVEVVSSSANQFHSDGMTVDKKVHVCRVAPFLGRNVSNLSAFEHFKKNGLGIVHNMVSFFSNSLFSLLQRCGFPTLVPIVGKPSLFYCGEKPGFTAWFRKLRDYVSGLSSLGIKLNGKQPVSNNGSVNNSLGEHWHHTKLFKEICNRGGGSVVIPSKRGGGLPIAVSSDNVVSVSSEFKTCHVYNLQCFFGLYHANGFIVKNCAGLDGNMYPVGVGPNPPIHWQCRSIRVPIVKDEYKIPGIEGKRPAVGENKDGEETRGQVSADTKYSGWLRKQSDEFQNEVLGARRADLFRARKVSLDRFVDNTGAVIKLDQLRTNDGILTSLI